MHAANTAADGNMIKVGLVGTGITRAHASGYKRCQDVEMKAICDIDKARAEQFAADFDVKDVYTDYNEMLKDDEIVAVSVGTPNALHAPVAIAAFEAGKHVICEKPLATNAGEGRAMVEAGKKAGKIFMMGFNNRFRGDTQLLKKCIENGDLGDIYYAKTGWLRRKGIPGMGGWFTTKKMSGGGPLIDLGVHVLDLTLWLMGNPAPAAVTGVARAEIAHQVRSRRQGLFADHVLARLQGSDGQRGMIVVGCADVDDVDVGIPEQVVDVGVQLGDAVLLTPFLKNCFVDVCAGDQLCMLRCFPAGDMYASDTSHTDNSYF